MECKKMKLCVNETEVIDKAKYSEIHENPTGNEEKIDVSSPPKFTVTFELELWEKIWKIEEELSAELMKIDFKKDKNIAAIYNPLEYASDVHKNYMRKYLKKAPEIVFLGMNPGLYGMCQTSASELIYFCSSNNSYFTPFYRSHLVTFLLLRIG